MRKTIIAALLLLAVPAGAADDRLTRAKPIGTDNSPTVLSAVDMSGAAGTRTFTGSGLAGYDYLILYVDFTADGDATDLTITCTDGPKDDNAYIPTECTGSAGNCTVNAGGVITFPANTTGKWRVEYGLHPSADFSCVAAATGATASDVLTVKAYAVTK